MKTCGVFAFHKGDDILKNIQIAEGAWCLKSFYQAATTPATRALVGYMIKTCKTDDILYSSALYLLKDIESCKANELYYLETCIPANKTKEIVHIVESARQGKYKKFAIRKKEIKKILRNINKERK